VLSRYRTSADGEHAVAGRVYTRDEHAVVREQIDRDAVAVVGRLQRAGYEAYVVGGAIRDLVTGRQPKDFDIATSALPRQVTQLFSRARIIGKRFKLVHVPTGRKGFFEVSTFRGPGTDGNNHYGTMIEDVFRRDFTVNGLYYCPRRQQIIDYVNGFSDLTARRLRTIGDPELAFVEDPVRMLRAIKYSAFLNVRVPERYRKLIRRHAMLLGKCAAGRLSEELRKLLSSGNASDILLDCARTGLLAALLPAVDRQVRPRRQDPLISELARIEQTVPIGESVRLRAMTALAATVNRAGGDTTLRGVKLAFAPLMITNDDAHAILQALSRNNQYGQRAGYRVVGSVRRRVENMKPDSDGLDGDNLKPIRHSRRNRSL
jgi:poly(A) polymerase